MQMIHTTKYNSMACLTCQAAEMVTQTTEVMPAGQVRDYSYALDLSQMLSQ